nr:MAG TPA: hypothetical protein [Caudoviricetes sp.]
MMKVVKTILFCIINPHLIVMLIFAAMLLGVRKSLYYLSGKLDDAARYVQNVDYKLGAKSYPAWFRSLVDDEVK